MHKMMQLWRGYLNGVSANAENPLAMRKLHFIISISAIGIFNFLAFGLLYLFDGQLFNAFVELGFGALAVANILVLRYHRHTNLAARTLMYIVFPALLFLLYTGGIHETGILWLYTFPAIAYFLRGRKPGLYWCLAVGAAIMAAIVLEFLNMTSTAYDLLTLRQALIAFAVVTLLLYFYEDYNERSRRYVVETNEHLSHLNAKLKQEVRERQEAQVQYGMSLHDIEEKNRQLEDTKRAMLNVLEDLNEEKQTAESAKSRDSALLNSIAEGLIFIDENGLVANVNPSALKMLGYERNQLMGKWFPGTVIAKDENGEEIESIDRPVARAMSTGQPVTQIAQYRRKNGSFFPVAITVSPVILDGRPLGAIEVFRDITKEHELERAKEDFVSLASHQLRTPATGIKAYVSMLLDGYAGKLSPRQRSFMEKIDESNERQLEVVNDMLNVARIDAGRMVPAVVEMDMTTLLAEVIDEQRQIIADREQILETDIGSGPIMMEGDPKLLRMVVDNLLSNASKYTPNGGRLSVTVSTTSRQFKVTVTDEGVGIARSDVSRLFQRFSRIDNQLSTARGGTGLGLYLAANIAALHGGVIEVSSQPGRGSRFTLKLPLQVTAKNVSKKAGVRV